MECELSNAALPLVPILIAAVTALTGGLTIILSMKSKKVKGKSWCVLGPKAAGKTQFTCLMRGVDYKGYEATTQEKYVNFDCAINGECYHVSQITDISGDESVIKSFYEELILQSDVIVFVFDAKKYFSDDNEYLYRKKEVYGRLYRIAEIEEKLGQRETIVLATHRDELSKEQQNTFFNTVVNNAGEKSKKLLLYNFFLIDCTSKKEFNKLLHKIKIK